MLIPLAFLFATDLPAQESPAPRLGNLEAGRVVRVRFVSGERVESRLVSVESDSLILSLDGGSVGLASRNIDSLWVKGRATMMGALVGAATGAVGSVVISAGVCQAIREDFPCGESGSAIAAAVVGGAGLGAFIGSFVPRWRLRFVRQPVRGASVTVWPGVPLAISIGLP